MTRNPPTLPSLSALSALSTAGRETSFPVNRPADLHYVDDSRPGLTRRLLRGEFAYFGVDGHRIGSLAEIARIHALARWPAGPLAIPPACEDVWICPDPRGHLQATGRDAWGRKQYRYRPRWREARDANKYERMLAFGAALPLIRVRVSRDLKRKGLPRDKSGVHHDVAATVLREERGARSEERGARKTENGKRKTGRGVGSNDASGDFGRQGTGTGGRRRMKRKNWQGETLADGMRRITPWYAMAVEAARAPGGGRAAEASRRKAQGARRHARRRRRFTNARSIPE